MHFPQLLRHHHLLIHMELPQRLLLLDYLEKDLLAEYFLLLLHL